MREYLADFLERFSYPEEARNALLEAYGRIRADEAGSRAFDGILRRYEADIRRDLQPLLDEMSAVAAGTGVHVYTAHLLLLIAMSRHLLDCYREAGIDEQIWFTSMCDLKWKLTECRLVRGIWGTFVADWLARYFQMDRFGLLRLQFEPYRLGYHYEKDGLVLTPDTPAINTHIPRTGGRLDRESAERSFAMAADFFKERYRIDPPVFVCQSWLLYRDNLEILSPDSNLYSFITRFDILSSKEKEAYEDAWRLFDREYTGDVDQLPQDTSLRRAYADWIRRGKKFGEGYGVYLYRPKQAARPG